MKYKICPPKKPNPPCPKGYFEKEKEYKDGLTSKCCYKTKKIKNYKKKRECPPKKLNPPCQENFISRRKNYSNGEYSICCYKNIQKTEKSKKIEKKPKNWPNFLAWPLDENINLNILESKSPLFQLKTEFFTYNIKSTEEKKNNGVIKSDKLNIKLMEFDEQFEIKNKKQLDKLVSKHPEGLLVTEKMDGHRMYWDGKEGRSRTGKTNFNLPPFWREILELSPEPLDGELFLPGFPASQVSTLRGKSFLGYQLWHDVAEYHLFDLPKSELPYVDRLKKLQKIGDLLNKNIKNTRKFIKVIPSKLMKKADEIDNYFQEIMKKEKKSHYCIDQKTKTLIPDFNNQSEHVAEGLILGIVDKKYYFGLSNYKMKYKGKYENDCVVIEPHPTKASLKVYRNDCKPNEAIFYLSTEGRPKKLFKKGDILKYTCFGFSKGNDRCPNLPKMPKLKDFRTEDIKNKKTKKTKLDEIPKNSPNEKFAKYYDEIGKSYFKKGMTKKGIAYKKHANILRRHDKKLKKNEDCINLLGKGSIGKQCLCIINEIKENKNWMKTCAEGRLD